MLPQVQIALDRARHLRRVSGALAQLSGAARALGAGGGLPPALEAQLHDRLLQLQLSMDRLANVKEFRIPQARGRALV